MFVREVMTKNPVTTSEKTTVVEALEQMRRERIRRLPVVSGPHLVGIVTELDLIRVSPSSATTLSVFELHYVLAKMLVKDVMAKRVITVAPGATVEQAAVLMRDADIGGLPVVDGDELVGIVTETNLFDAFLEHFGVRRGGIRVTVRAEDRPGRLAALADAIRDLGGNVVSLVTSEPASGVGGMVVRVTGVTKEALCAGLAAQGLDVVHASE